MKPVIIALLAASGLALHSSPTDETLSPAQRKIIAGREALERQPDVFQRYNELALALSRRAREIADPDFYAQSDAALAKSLELAPDNFAARKLQVWNLLGRHEFAAALEAAEELNALAPDDVLVYGFLTDANVELGNYAAAEEAAQWMLDLRPGNIAGLTRAAYLREHFGDVDGAIELMLGAYHSMRASEVEDRAWALTQVAHLELSRGTVHRAEVYVEEALGLFPDYHYALAELAKVRANQGKRTEAIELLRRRYEVAPHPENLYDLAVELLRAGDDAEARSKLQAFETQALAESEALDNANLALIEYYLGQAEGDRAAEALALARRMTTVRRDVNSLEALAWALHANGQDVEAAAVMRELLAVGIRDARKFYRAGVVFLAAGATAEARSSFLAARLQDPGSEFTAAAGSALRSLPEMPDGERR